MPHLWVVNKEKVRARNTRHLDSSWTQFQKNKNKHTNQRSRYQTLNSFFTSSCDESQGFVHNGSFILTVCGGNLASKSDKYQESYCSIWNRMHLFLNKTKTNLCKVDNQAAHLKEDGQNISKDLVLPAIP